MHAFGAWLANLAAARGHSGELTRDKIVANINKYKASNGEEIHGYLWQSLRLLAHKPDTLAGPRLPSPSSATATLHAHQVCSPMWRLSPQTMNDCAHAAGHGYFYYFLDIGKAILACTDPSLRDHTPGPEMGWDADPKSYGWDGINLLMWRWLCATGVYHAAANTISVEMLHEIGTAGDTVEEYLCKHMNTWSETTRYFDRCAAGLGMIDAEHRLAKVMSGACKRTPGAMAAEWETRQMKQFGGTLQLSCDPASLETGFTVAMGTCPAAFRMHFPCVEGAPDYEVSAHTYLRFTVPAPFRCVLTIVLTDRTIDVWSGRSARASGLAASSRRTRSQERDQSCRTTSSAQATTSSGACSSAQTSKVGAAARG